MRKINPTCLLKTVVDVKIWRMLTLRPREISKSEVKRMCNTSTCCLDWRERPPTYEPSSTEGLLNEGDVRFKYSSLQRESQHTQNG